MKYYTTSKLSENIQETPEGFLVCLNVPIARTGWQVYGQGETPLESGSDGKVKVYRDAQEVFHADTIASYQGKPLTIGHPEEFVNPANWSELTKGVIQHVRRGEKKDEDGEECLLADVLVTDAKAIELIKAGLREVSCGYEAVYEQTGEGKGRQVSIIGNHLALVEEGRAGPAYAINDHKTERLTGMSKFTDKVKHLFAKAIDEAEASEKKEEMKDESHAAQGSPAVMDELVKMVKDLGEKLEGMKPKDAVAPEVKKESDEKMEEKKEEAKDADISPALEARLKAMEEKLAKLMEMESAEAEMGDEEEKAEDADMEESEDESSETGDTAARAEILAPGIKVTKNVKAKALQAAYGTKEGKAVIDSLSGGKTPTFDSAETVSTLFIAASEVLKAKRGTGLEKSKTSKAFDSVQEASFMTAERMNEMNQAFWNKK